MLGEQGVRLPIHRTPKFVLGQFLGRQAFRKQSVKFFLGSGKTRYRSLLDGSQSGLHDFLNGPIGATTNDLLDPSFLFRREMNCHRVPRLRFSHFQSTKEPLL